MANGHSEEFNRDAVRIALTIGLTRRQVASDLGMGVSTLNKWIKVAQDTEDASLPNSDLVREVERLRKENTVLKQEREILKKDETFVRLPVDAPLVQASLATVQEQRSNALFANQRQ